MSTATEPPNTGHVLLGKHRLGLRAWFDVVKRTFKEFIADDCMGLAGQIAFSSLLAFFPAMILLVGLLGLIDAYDDLKEFLAVIAPAAAIETIAIAEESAEGGGGSALAVVLGAGGAVWAASGALNAVVKAVNAAHDRVETRPRWRLRLISIVLVFANGLVFAALFLLIVFGGPLGEAIASHARLGEAFEVLWGIARWPIAFAGVLLFYALVYYAGPNVEPRSWKWITPGSLVGSAAWLGLSALFALYTSHSSSYDRTYGSLAGGIILLLWLYYSAFALLFGAELNAELDRQANIHAGGGEKADRVEPARRPR